MTSTIKKQTAISYAPGSPGVPATAGRPAIPPYTGYELREVCSFQSIGTGELTRYVYVCTTTPVLVSYPGLPAVAPTPGVAPIAAQVIADYNFGWNSGGRSIGNFNVDGHVEFTASTASLGVIAGLNETDPDAGYRNINYGFQLSRGIARIIEDGIEKLYVGAFTAASVFRISRRDGVVKYYVDDVLTYTSLIESDGDLFMDVSLYAGGDYVDNPEIGADSFGTASLSFEPLEVNGGIAYAQSGPLTRLQPLTAYGAEGMAMDLELQPLTLLAGDRIYGEVSANLAEFTLSAGQIDAPPPYALGSMSLAMLSMAAHGLTGEVGQIDESLQPVQLLAGEGSYGEARLSLQPLAILATAYEGNTGATMLGLATATNTMTYIGFVDVVLLDGAGMATTMGTLVLKDAAMAETANVADTMTFTAILQALMETNLSMFAGIPVLTEDGEVWVVNDETGASTSYENYGFNSFAKYKGKYLGAKADGFFLLEGDTDDGSPVRSAISFGKHDFGTSAKKTVPNCYIGLASDGRVFLRVIADGQTYTYKTVTNTDYLATQRIKIGRGLAANYITFELYNEEGADFELAPIEFEAITLSRRI